VSDRKRYMLKFQFARMREPEAPTWDHRSARWETPVDPRREPVCRHVWDWLRGERASPEPAILGEPDERELRRLRECSEEERLRSAYALGAAGAAAVPMLLEELRREARLREAGIEDRTPDNLH